MSNETYIIRREAPRRVRRGPSARLTRRGWLAAASLPLGGSAVAVRVLLLMALMLMVGAFGLLWSSPAYAEGSKELSSQGGDRAFLEYRPGAATAGIARRTEIKVYAKSGETINLGSSAHGFGSGTIRYTRPDGSTGTCAAPGSNNNFAGRIENRARELAGPLPNANGYTPCTVTVGTGQTGVWKVEFTSPSPTNTASPEPLTTTENWSQPDTASYIAAWDVTVRSSAGTYVPGRVYANHLALNMGANGRSFMPKVYVQARSGYRFRLDPNGLDPFGFIFFANNKGFKDSSGTPIYRSVQLSTSDDLPSGTTLHDPSSADTASDVTHKLFFNTPNSDLPASAAIAGGSTWLANTPTAPPNITNFSFTGSEGTSNQAALGQGGSFTFTSDAAGPFKIYLDISGDGTYGNANDRLLIGAAGSGQNTVTWDGRDGNGNVVSAGTGSIRANMTAYAGEVHFPMLDAENNPNGSKIERLNPSSDYTIHYDNTGLTGSGTAPNPLGARAGLSSQNGAQAFSGTWGDHKGVDAWSFGTSSSIALQSNIEIKSADLSVTKTDNQTAMGSGDQISYTIRATNNGPSAISGATLTDAVPTGVTNVSWNCAVTTGTGSCGTTSGSSNDVQTSLTLASGAVATVTVTGTLTNAAAATLTNTVNVARPNDVNDPNAANNSATDTTSINRSPVPGDDSPSTNENTQGIFDVRANDTDPDSGQTLSITSVGNPAKGTAQLIASGPDAGKIRYTPNADFSGTDSFTYTLCDNGNPVRCATATVNVTVNNVNTRPVVDLNGGASGTGYTAAFAEDGGAVVVGDAAGLTVADADDANLEGAIVTITNRPDGASERLLVDVSGTAINASYDAQTGVLSLTGTATKVDYERALRSVRYENASQSPSTAVRSITFAVSDGDASSEVATSTVSVSASNDRPVLDLNGGDNGIDYSTTFIEGGGPVAAAGMLTVTDVDDANVEGATVTLTNRPDGDAVEGLTADTTGTTINASYAASTGVLTLTGQATKADYQKVLRTVRYENTSETPATANRIVEFVVDDGDAGSGVARSTIAAEAVNDAPVLYVPGSRTTNEDTPLVFSGANKVSVSDADVGSNAVEVTLESTNGTFTMNSTAGLAFSMGDGTGDIKAVFRGTVADVNAALDGLSYAPTADYNGPARLTITTDDLGNTGTGGPGTDADSVQITVNPVNDAPVGKADAYETDEDVTMRIGAPAGVLRNDSDVDGEAISAKRVVTNPEHGTLTLSPDGSFEYVPEAGYSGDDSFEYEVCDEADNCAEPVAVSITVNPVNDVPSATGDSYDAAENTLLEVSAQDGVLGNDTDSDPLVAVLAQGPDSSKGTLTLRPDGSFTFQPASGFDGTVTFTYRACEEANPNVCSEPVTVTVDVAASDGAPVVRDDGGSTGEAAAVSNAYISQYASTKASTPTRLYQFNTTQSLYTLDKRGSDIARPMNAIGYRSTDLSLYGYRMTKQPGIVKVNPQTGATRYLGKPSGLPTSVGYIAGDVSPDGSTYYLYANKARVLWKVDLATFRATSIKLSSPMSVADFAVSPTDGNLYGVAKDGKLLRVDPQTGQATAGSVAGLKAGTYGAAWFTAQGDLLVYENGTSRTSGTLVWLTDPATAPSVLSTKAGPYTKGNDGAAYVADPGQSGLSVAIDVLATDEDPDGALDRSSLRIVQQPAHGAVTINADKTITYTSGSSYRGTDSYRYEVCDSGATPQCGTATVNITSAPTTASESPASGQEEETP